MRQSRKHGVLGLFTKDPNLIWLIRHLEDEHGFPTSLEDNPEDLSNEKNLSLLILDLDFLGLAKDYPSLISEFHRKNPDTCIFVISSRSDLSEILLQKEVEQVFLKPYSIEHLYNSILSRFRKMDYKQKSDSNRSIRPQAKVLIVDDELEVCEFIRDVLEEAEVGDFKVQYAQDPDVALKLCADFEPDFVIVDLKLPQVSGIELIERLKKIQGTARPKDFLIFTGSDSMEMQKRFENQGYRFLAKPCSTGDLLEAVTQLCRKWKLVKKAA